MSRSVLAGCCAFFLLGLLASQLAVGAIFQKLTMRSLLAAYSSLILCAIATLAYASVRSGRHPRHLIAALHFNPRSVWIAMLTAFCMWIASLLLSRLLVPPIWPFDIEASTRQYAALVESPSHFAIFAALACVVAPLAEESFFRGFLQHHLRGHTKPLAAILFSAAFFAILHPWSQLPLTFALGLALGTAFELGGGLAAPILAHVTWNAHALIVMMR